MKRSDSYDEKLSQNGGAHITGTGFAQVMGTTRSLPFLVKAMGERACRWVPNARVRQRLVQVSGNGGFPDTHTLIHVEELAVFGDTTDEGGCQVSVF